MVTHERFILKRIMTSPKCSTQTRITSTIADITAPLANKIDIKTITTKLRCVSAFSFESNTNTVSKTSTKPLRLSRAGFEPICSTSLLLRRCVSLRNQCIHI